MSRFLVLMLVSLSAFADCPQFYPYDHEIAVPDSIELCNSFYAVKFDTAHNATIISVEKYRETNHTERINDFHDDKRLPAESRAENADYLHSGYDKGHMTPAGDATDAKEMDDTFLLSNMTPQEPTLNRDAWRLLEIRVRNMQPEYIVTGAIYPKEPKTIGGHHVPVPAVYYKIAYDCPMSIHVWFAKNKPHGIVAAGTIDGVERLSGLKFPRCE